MRAKLVVTNVKENFWPEPGSKATTVKDGVTYEIDAIPQKQSEQVSFRAVCKDDYSSDPLDENNTYAQYSPSADLNITIANPALFGKLKVDQQFYVDFTPAN